MKEKLTTVLGGFGAVLYYLFAIVSISFPLAMIEMPGWLNTILFIVVLLIPKLIGPLLIVGLLFTVFGPQDVVAIIYYVFFGIVVAITYIPALCFWLSERKERS